MSETSWLTDDYGYGEMSYFATASQEAVVSNRLLLAACYEEREKRAKEDWVIPPVWAGALHWITHSRVTPDTRYYNLPAPLAVDDKTGLQQGERVIRFWVFMDEKHVETNLGREYVLRGSAMNPDARWERV